MSTDTSTPATPADAIAALDALDGTPAPASAPPVTPAPAPEADAEADVDLEGAEALGDAGKQALDRMKARLKAEQERRRAAEDRLRESLPQDDAQRLAADAEAKALAKANARIVRAEIRAAAAGKLADPSDALTFIDPASFEVDDDGEVDQAEIADAIAALVAKKPYLAAQGGTKAPRPDPSQGVAGGAPATAADRFAAQTANLI